MHSTELAVLQQTLKETKLLLKNLFDLITVF